MIPDISVALAWLKVNSQTLNGICRGVEREALRINVNGRLAKTSHPKILGSSLTHKWITTDFAESLLEFITPIDNNIDSMLTTLRDIHRYVSRRLGNERLWPMSMPCCIDNPRLIKIAQYGNSNIGKMKTLYRKGLKNRYSELMQVIAGVHYNFSFPIKFWQSYKDIRDDTSGKEVISAGYLQLIRNYYRFGWIIPYLFGASPGMSTSFFIGKAIDLPFKKKGSEFVYLPYATSLRLSDLGYINQTQSQLNITFNHLEEYIRGLKEALNTPSIKYDRFVGKQDGHYLQLNNNVLQIENELYAPIRPKRAMKDNESLCEALIRGGIEYVEVRALDVNPFSPVGVDEEQILFLDLFLIWCTLATSPEIRKEELILMRSNWDRVVLEGRRPGLMLRVNSGGKEESLKTLGKLLLIDLMRLAEILDKNNGNTNYKKVGNNLIDRFDNPSFTLSGRFLEQLKEHGFENLGLILSNHYHRTLCDESLELLNQSKLDTESLNSWHKQRDLERKDYLIFDEFLESYNNKQKN
ncbi:glutamate-cysteine ligase [secondary endosymbiont of Heteropsylla cubana]|uniref:Glutamate--cysteine ligase n=1 Tax=secondary endosymbiont of Heteropsylla cubana TaxID=134287 RepID=J3Z640_9ENTR|nr:glutamate--cysteine ligase [secondary endosymbiont of Heteropsylla cubana]AFP85844.1 glutamate-cysteine ligase [secondary endosymbiont of Heteropsylla cubana]